MSPVAADSQATGPTRSPSLVVSSGLYLNPRAGAVGGVGVSEIKGRPHDLATNNTPSITVVNNNGDDEKGQHLQSVYHVADPVLGALHGL